MKITAKDIERVFDVKASDRHIVSVRPIGKEFNITREEKYHGKREVPRV